MYDFLMSGEYPSSPLAPEPEQKYALFQCLNATRRIYNLALEQRREYAAQKLRIYGPEQIKNITPLRQQEPSLQVLPYGCVDALLRQMDFYGMKNRCLPDFAASDDWHVIPYRKGVVPNEGGVWIPKIGLVPAGKRPKEPFRSAWVVKSEDGWILRTKPTAPNIYLDHVIS